VHEEYAVQRWPETKRLLGLLVNSAGAAHARNARRLVQAARKHDRPQFRIVLAGFDRTWLRGGKDRGGHQGDRGREEPKKTPTPVHDLSL